MENIRELIEEFCNEQDLNFRDDYSGRGMYGRKCVGITCYSPLATLADLFAYIVDSDDEICGGEVLETLGKPKMDSMGMEKILYFPNVETD